MSNATADVGNGSDTRSACRHGPLGPSALASETRHICRRLCPLGKIFTSRQAEIITLDMAGVYNKSKQPSTQPASHRPCDAGGVFDEISSARCGIMTSVKVRHKAPMALQGRHDLPQVTEKRSFAQTSQWSPRQKAAGSAVVVNIGRPGRDISPSGCHARTRANPPPSVSLCRRRRRRATRQANQQIAHRSTRKRA